LFLLIPEGVSARTWFVEVDDSGDFSDLQSASDAAASGDTIKVGVGRFGEPAWSECLGDNLFTIMAIGEGSIVIIGEGDGQSIIGPEEPWSAQLPFRAGIAAVGWCETTNLEIKGIQFENLTHAVHCEFALNKDKELNKDLRSETSLTIEDCTFQENYLGLMLDANVNRISNCLNTSTLLGAKFIANYMGAPVREINIQDCQSEFTNMHTSHVGVSGDLLRISGCVFDGGGVNQGQGLGINSSRFELINSRISGDRFGLNFYGNDLYVNDCEFSNLKKGIWFPSQEYYMEIENTNFSDILVSSISYGPTTRGGFVRNCNLEKGAQYTVSHTPSKNKSESGKNDQAEYYNIDMSNNWWGTADPDSIQAWIEDGMDDEDWPYYIVWRPFLDETVPAEEKSLDNIKALFR